MTATHAEVLRSLPPEITDTGVIDGAGLRGSCGRHRWELQLAPAPRLRVGSLDLAATELVIRLWGYSEAERARFIERLEQFMRRGGG